MNDALRDMKQQVNKIKANQMGGALPLVETVEEVETVLSSFFFRDEPRTIHGSNELCQ